MSGKIRTMALYGGLATLLWAVPAGAEEACVEMILAKCTSCHYQTRICQEIGQKSRRGWEVSLKRMLRYGLQLSGAEQDKMLDCLQALEKKRGTLCK